MAYLTQTFALSVLQLKCFSLEHDNGVREICPDEEVWVEVVVHVQTTRERPAEGADTGRHISAVYYLEEKRKL